MADLPFFMITSVAPGSDAWENYSMQIAGREIQISGRLVRIARSTAEFYESTPDPIVLSDALRKSAARVDLFTFMQKLPDTTPQYTYRMEWDNVAALRVTTFDHWLDEQADPKARNKVRLAEKRGVVTRELEFDDALVRGISAIYDETPVRQGRSFPHFGKDLSAVCRDNGTFLERSIFIGALLGDELVGFAKLVSDPECRQAGLMQIVSLIRHRTQAPTNALIAAAVRACAAREIPFLVYAHFAYGKKAADGLSNFKHSNGFRRVDLPRYYVPLTPLGRFAIRLGLHRPMTDILPQPLLVSMRRLRSRWYARGQPAVGE